MASGPGRRGDHRTALFHVMFLRQRHEAAALALLVPRWHGSCARSSAARPWHRRAARRSRGTPAAPPPAPHRPRPRASRTASAHTGMRHPGAAAPAPRICPACHPWIRPRPRPTAHHRTRLYLETPRMVCLFPRPCRHARRPGCRCYPKRGRTGGPPCSINSPALSCGDLHALHPAAGLRPLPRLPEDRPGRRAGRVQLDRHAGQLLLSPAHRLGVPLHGHAGDPRLHRGHALHRADRVR